MIRILIVDDQNLVQQGIKSLLERDLDFKVIGTVKDGRNAVQQIAQIHPDVVLLDIEMPGMDGITTTKYINRVSPNTKVIILSSHEEKKYVTRALMAGAKGYLLKSSLMTDLKQAILAVNNGYSQIDSRLLAKVFDPKNVRAKKTNLEKEKNVIIQDSSTSQNDIEVKKTKSEYNNLVTPLKDSNATPSWKTEKVETSESDTAIQSETSTAVSSETTKWKSKETTFSYSGSDSVVLKQVNPKKEAAKLNANTGVKEDQRQSSHIVSQTTLATLEQKSFQEQHKSANFNLLLKQKTVLIVDRVKKLLDSFKMLVRKPKINQFQPQLEQYKIKLLSLIQHKHKRKVFWNIIFVVLGIVVVVILGS